MSNIRHSHQQSTLFCAFIYLLSFEFAYTYCDLAEEDCSDKPAIRALTPIHRSELDRHEMETVDIQAVESKLSDVTVTAIPMTTNKTSPVQNPVSKIDPGQSKYAQLLGVIEEMGREVRPTYAGSRSSAERLKRNIVCARILVKECLIETEKSARQ